MPFIVSIPIINANTTFRDFFLSLIKNDQLGRLIAVFIIAPILLVKGLYYKDTFIQIFALLLFIWDLYWLLTQPAKKQNILF